MQNAKLISLALVVYMPNPSIQIPPKIQVNYPRGKIKNRRAMTGPCPPSYPTPKKTDIILIYLYNQIILFKKFIETS
jgi:hypothetical protein